MTNRNKKIIAIISIVFLILLVVAPVGISTAQGRTGIVPCTGVSLIRNDGGCDFDALGQMFVNLIRFAITTGLALSSIGFAWAGILYLTANGSSEQIKKAHEVFKKILFGFIIAISAFIIVDLITFSLGMNTSVTGKAIIDLYNSFVK